MGEELLRRHLDEAFRAPADFPDERLVSRAVAAIADQPRPRRWAGLPALRVPRVAGQAVAAVLVLVLAVAAAGVFIALHRPQIGVTPVPRPLVFPTKMVTATIGWAETQHGATETVWRTTDGGASWTDVSPPVGGYATGGWVTYFLDATHAWVVLSDSGGLVVVRTADGGRTWQRGTSLPAKFEAPSSIDVLDGEHGWLLVSTGSPFRDPQWPSLYATSDGGMHWSLVNAHAGARTEPSGLVPGESQVRFTSPSTGWMTVGLYQAQADGSTTLQRNVLVVTRDGGRTWLDATLPVQPGPGPFSVIDLPTFFGDRGITAVHEVGNEPTPRNAVLLTTSDGGVTWTAHPTAWQTVGEIQFVDADHGFALAGPSSLFLKQRPSAVPLPLFRTADGGATWIAVHADLDLITADGKRLNDIQFVDRNVGYASLWSSQGPAQLFRTEDGGTTWKLIAVCKPSGDLTYPPDVCS